MFVPVVIVKKKKRLTYPTRKVVVMLRLNVCFRLMQLNLEELHTALSP